MICLIRLTSASTASIQFDRCARIPLVRLASVRKQRERVVVGRHADRFGVYFHAAFEPAHGTCWTACLERAARSSKLPRADGTAVGAAVLLTCWARL